MKRTTSSLHRAHSKGSFNRLVFESEHSLGGGDNDRSLIFRFCQLIVVIIRAITPLSYLFLAYIYVFNISSKNFYIGELSYYVIVPWAIAEALFFPYYYYLFTKLSNMNHELEHFASDREKRFGLVKRCFEALHVSAMNTHATPELYIRKGMFQSISI